MPQIQVLFRDGQRTQRVGNLFPERMTPTQKQLEQLRREHEALQTVVIVLGRQVDELEQRLKQLEEKKR
jgi:chaperonin cofactor prefoldin